MSELRPSARLALAFGFLTRLPLPSSLFIGLEGMPLARACALFPVVGLVVAALCALPLLVAASAPLVAAVLAVLARGLITGFLHDDGLADCGDAVWGGRDAARRLEIMKDPRIGTYGAAMLALAFALEIASLFTLLGGGLALATVALAVALACSRAALVMHWRLLPDARPGGLAATSGRPADVDGTIALVIGGIAALCAVPVLGLVPVVVALLAGTVALWFSILIARQMIGGMTGDTLGATERVVALAMLAALAIAAA